MNSEEKISKLYFMLFNENPNLTTLKSLLKIFQEHDDSLDYLETNLRNSDEFKKLSTKLEIELEVAELFYILLNRKPDISGLTYFRNQIIECGKSLDWVNQTIKNSEEYKSKIF